MHILTYDITLSLSVLCSVYYVYATGHSNLYLTVHVHCPLSMVGVQCALAINHSTLPSNHGTLWDILCTLPYRVGTMR